MARDPYRRRIVDRELRERLAATGAVLIEGARASGKTMTARQAAASEVLLEVDDYYREAAQLKPELVLDGPAPRLIDEWQAVPSIWNRIRREVDDRGQPGQFILTGSARPTDEITRHTGAGRITRLRMRPMTLYECDRSTGDISLEALLGGEQAVSSDPGLSLDDVIDEIIVGGWPQNRELSVADARLAVRDYLREVSQLELGRLTGLPRHDPARVTLLMRSLARNVSTQAALTTLARDASENEGLPIRDDTVREYLKALEQVMVIEDQPAWATHLRSKYAIRTKPKRHFTDPSLAAAALRATPEGLWRDLKLLGFLFESLVVRDLRVYAQSCDATVFHYRDSQELEADAIVETGDGRWAAFEVKLGPGGVDEGAASLLKMARRVDTSRAGEPALLGVIVATGLGYPREDGVQVIPIGSLGP